MGVREYVGTRPMWTVRTRDLAEVYAVPRTAARDLTTRGTLHRLANGYHCLVPAHVRPDTWRPALETAAAAIATAIWGDGVPVVMGLSAARMHQALPRAIGDATVAAPTRRHALDLADRDGTVRFVMRDVAALDAERIATELGRTLVTSPAQTALDLARDPALLEGPDRAAIVRALLVRAPLEEIAQIAARQGRMGKALDRIRKLAE